MPPTSDEDLQRLQDDVTKLRDQVAAEHAKVEARSRAMNNDIAAAQLNAERVRLEAELSQARDMSKASTIKSASAGPLQSARDAVALATAQAKEAEALRTADANAKGGDAEPDVTSPPDSLGDAVAAKTTTTTGAPDAVRSN